MEVVEEGFPNCSTKNLNKEPSRLAFFKALGSDRILGNDKRVGVPVFTNRKIKTTNLKAKHARVTLSERATSY